MYINDPTFRSFFFFFNDTATTEIYTLSLHDALPISLADPARALRLPGTQARLPDLPDPRPVRIQAEDQMIAEHRGSGDRKSTRLNSSHLVISYAVFCLKKKKITPITVHLRDMHHRVT